MFKKILLFSLSSLLAFGCTNENTSDCEPRLKLHFRFSHGVQDQGPLSDRIQDIRVYIFDQSTELLYDIIQLSPADIERGYAYADLPNGLYTAVAWGGGSPDMIQGGYSDSQATAGTTTRNDFRMSLVANTLTGSPYAGEVPQLADFDQLFYAIREDITVVRHLNQTVDLDLIKNTSTLKVIVNGLGYLHGRAVSGMPFDVFATGKNWRYRYDNGFDASVPMLYEPYEGTVGSNSMEVLIRQQRLSVADNASSPVTLYVRDRVSNINMITPLDLLSAIRQNPAYYTQEAIDNEDLFVIEVSVLNDLTLTVTINGWKIVILDPDVKS